jgi:hypothetical protein
MIPVEELDHLLQRAIADPREEPMFFCALLDAMVYAHVPVSDDSGRLRFTMFARPDTGETVLPFFSHESLADECVGNERRVVALPGRSFFENTLGATLIFNPNDQRYVFYPEEISLLLNIGVIVQRKVEGTTLDSNTPVSPLGSKPNWLGHLANLFPRLPYIDIAYVAGTVLVDEPARPAALVILGVAPIDAERAIRTVLAIASAQATKIRVPVGVTTFDPAKGVPAILKDKGIEPFYVFQNSAKAEV